MTDATGRIEPYTTRFLEMREQLARILGTQTVDLIIERAAVEISGSYPEMALVHPRGDTLDLKPLTKAIDTKTEAEVRAMFDALSGVVMLILARILGKEVATRIVHSDGSGGAYARGPG